MSTVWVLTSEHNDYDQHGEYFEAIFKTKPTVDQLVKYFSSEGKGAATYVNPMGALAFLLHVQKGGGRQGNENVWYNLEEVEAF